MNRFILIAIGAAFGANTRYFIGLWAGDRLGADFPYGTLIVNVTGSLLLGFLVTLGAGRLHISTETRLLVTVGFLGSYTTFSAYTVESMVLLREAAIWRGVLNMAGNSLVGLLFAVLGAALARLVDSGG